jgi:hypothetical protein
MNQPGIKGKKLPKEQRSTYNQTCKIYCQNGSGQVKETSKDIFVKLTERINKKQAKNTERKKDRDTLKEKQFELILCECGCQSVRSSIARHRKKNME